jgi:hypothetical protein
VFESLCSRPRVRPAALVNDDESLSTDAGRLTMCQFAIRSRWQQNNVAIKNSASDAFSLCPHADEDAPKI